MVAWARPWAQRLGAADRCRVWPAGSRLAADATHCMPVPDADRASVPVLRRDTRWDRSWAGPSGRGVARLATGRVRGRRRNHPSDAPQDQPGGAVTAVARENTQYDSHYRYCCGPCCLRGLAASALRSTVNGLGIRRSHGRPKPTARIRRATAAQLSRRAGRRRRRWRATSWLWGATSWLRSRIRRLPRPAEPAVEHADGAVRDRDRSLVPLLTGRNCPWDRRPEPVPQTGAAGLSGEGCRDRRQCRARPRHCRGHRQERAWLKPLRPPSAPWPTPRVTSG